MCWQYLVMHSLLSCWHSQDVRDTHRLSLLFYLTFLRHLRLKRAAELLNRRDRDNLPSRSEAAVQTKVSEYFILTLDESMVRCLIICLTWCSLCHYIYMSVWSRHIWPLLVPGSLTLTLTIRVSAPGDVSPGRARLLPAFLRAVTWDERGEDGHRPGCLWAVPTCTASRGRDWLAGGRHHT